MVYFMTLVLGDDVFFFQGAPSTELVSRSFLAAEWDAAMERAPQLVTRGFSVLFASIAVILVNARESSSRQLFIPGK